MNYSNWETIHTGRCLLTTHSGETGFVEFTKVQKSYDGENLVVKDLKPNAENFIKNNKSNIVCLISKIDNKASIVVAVDKSLTSKFSAVEMVNEVSAILGGKGGGGRPDMAQSGGSDPINSLHAIDKIKDYIKLTT